MYDAQLGHEHVSDAKGRSSLERCPVTVDEDEVDRVHHLDRWQLEGQCDRPVARGVDHCRELHAFVCLSRPDQLLSSAWPGRIGEPTSCHCMSHCRTAAARSGGTALRASSHRMSSNAPMSSSPSRHTFSSIDADSALRTCPRKAGPRRHDISA